MAEKTNEQIGSTNTGTGRTAKGKGNTNSTSTENKTGGTTTRGRRTTAGTEKGKEPAGENVGLSDVTIDIPPVEDQPPAPRKQRGRPAGSTTNRRKTTKKVEAVNPNQIALLLLTVSGIAASKPGLEDFVLTAAEANQIAEPLANILSKSGAVGKATSEYADHIALLFAAFTIMLPKIMAYMHKRKIKKLEDEKNEYETRTTTARDQPISGQSGHSVDATSDGVGFNGSITELLPTII